MVFTPHRRKEEKFNGERLVNNAHTISGKPAAPGSSVPRFMPAAIASIRTVSATPDRPNPTKNILPGVTLRYAHSALFLAAARGALFSRESCMDFQ